MLIDHDELQAKCRKTMGGKVPRDARDRWGTFLKTRGTSFCFAPHWIVDWRIIEWAAANKEQVDFHGNGDYWKIEILDV